MVHSHGPRCSATYSDVSRSGIVDISCPSHVFIALYLGRGRVYIRRRRNERNDNLRVAVRMPYKLGPVHQQDMEYCSSKLVEARMVVVDAIVARAAEMPMFTFTCTDNLNFPKGDSSYLRSMPSRQKRHPCKRQDKCMKHLS